ncbi:hypothetical protein K461DRAFT_281777 [Myriangium duriaei CBS 260.36]|uniref:Secreted protein n=1 Tax=Myriangium duriaei CBS 260.36 TaxID=1168546 RepID=A0A9P4IYZ2_9PEZI|nr:hypothetical protein K461DRAFT_281777 [Myriangium duriaei CBS 260.36]
MCLWLWACPGPALGVAALVAAPCRPRPPTSSLRKSEQCRNLPRSWTSERRLSFLAPAAASPERQCVVASNTLSATERPRMVICSISSRRGAEHVATQIPWLRLAESLRGMQPPESFLTVDLFPSTGLPE